MRFLFFSFLMVFSFYCAASPQTTGQASRLQFRTLPHDAGMYQQISYKIPASFPLTIYAVTLHAQQYKATLYLQKKDMPQGIQHLSQKHHALVAINGGYYMENFEPDGLLIYHGKTLMPLKKNTLLSGLVSISTTGQLSLHQRASQRTNHYNAFQSGPILIQNDKVEVRDTQQFHRRTLLVESTQGDIVILSTSPASLYQLAQFLKEQHALLGISDIKQALNLDGGRSSALSINFKNNPIMLHELKPVRTVLFFYPLTSTVSNNPAHSH